MNFCRHKRITEKGRPTPKPNSLTKASKVFMRHFKDCNYEWLTANTEHKLFCWQCLLFNLSKVAWNDRPMDFIYKWQVSALLFDEYCIMHIVMEVNMVRLYYCGVWMSTICTVLLLWVRRNFRVMWLCIVTRVLADYFYWPCNVREMYSAFINTP